MARKTLNGIDAGGQRVTSVGSPSASGDAVPKSFLRYDLSSGPIVGQPAASEILMDFAAPVAFTLAVNLAGSVALASTGPASAATFTLTKNGASVATITFAAGATTATFTAASAISFVFGDRLQLVAPSSQDSALAGLTFSFAGVR